VGKDPTSEITALGNHPNITVTGTVDDIRPYLQKAAIAVSPLTYGAGVQNKVLESMACATPVVASKLAVSSLAASNGREVVVAEGPEDYARKIVELLDDQQMQRRVGHAGRYYVEKNHSWTSIAEKLEGVYYAIIKDEN
jgi:glycosyltransferase involved in cell wall biosynthesis